MARVKDMYYEAHVQVLVTYYVDVKLERLPPADAKKMLHYPETDVAKDIYMEVIKEHCL